jgi:hypothetical protein
MDHHWRGQGWNPAVEPEDEVTDNFYDDDSSDDTNPCDTTVCLVCGEFGRNNEL